MPLHRQQSSVRRFPRNAGTPPATALRDEQRSSMSSATTDQPSRVRIPARGLGNPTGHTGTDRTGGPGETAAGAGPLSRDGRRDSRHASRPPNLHQ